MSLKKKIALSFFISSFIIALLAMTEYISFLDIRKEIRNLEIADSMRSKSLQLRRHEKNFFLYPKRAADEVAEVYRYLEEMESLTADKVTADSTGRLVMFRGMLDEYRQRFDRIELAINSLSNQFGDAIRRIFKSDGAYELFRLTFREHPLPAAEFLEKTSSKSLDRRLIDGLKTMDAEIQALRRNGENILDFAKEMDRQARGRVDRVISFSQIAILIVFPIFFISGIGTLFLISRNVVSRLKLLTDSAERTGKGQFSAVAALPNLRWGNDEVGILMKEFNVMETQLAEREEELKRKSEELLQSRKLAAIGTLASGVAHELNNPLNNIYISAQVLEKEAKQSCSPMVIGALHDILGQTVRVKNIVGDLLEFARGKDLRLGEVDLREIIMGAYKMVSTAVHVPDMTFSLDASSPDAFVEGDSEQLERVFINLFSNAMDAMRGLPRQELKIKIARDGRNAIIMVSDTGRGIPGTDLDKVFEPFYSTKDKGTGLGLAIVFNIVKKHGGEMRVESAEGSGTTFVITLPLIR
jgi:two-component system NtrC family sensor kinase